MIKRKVISVITILVLLILISILPLNDDSVQAQLPIKLPPSVIEFDNISVEDGLSSPIVNDIIQDNYGFIWIATANGLNKFDGYSFTNYYPDPEDPNNPNTISGGYVLDLVLDNDGVIWIATDNGLNSYNPRTDEFDHWLYQQGIANGISHNDLKSIIQDDDGFLWIATGGGGVEKFDISSKTFTHFKHDSENLNSISSNTVFSIFQDSEENIWFGTVTGLDRFSPELNNFTHYSPRPNDPSTITFGPITGIMEDSHGYIWISKFSGGLSRYDRSSDSFKHYTHNPNNPSSVGNNSMHRLFEDSFGTLWLPLYNSGGVDVYDRVNDKFIHYKHDPNIPSSIASNSNISVFEDKSGVLWFATDGGGISKYDRKSERFSVIKNNPNDPNSLSDNDINAIFEDSYGYIWFGTEGGLNRYNQSTKSYVIYEHDPDDPNSISSNSVFGIDEDDQGNLWIATNVGINKFIRSDNTFEHHKRDPENQKSLQDNVVWSVLVDTEGYVWAGTQSKGMNRYDPITDSWKAYPTSNFILTIYENSSGDIFSGGDLGLYKFNRAEDAFDLIGSASEEPNSLSNNKINSIFEDSFGNFWVGTWNGLNYFDLSNNEFSYFLASDGLIDSYITSIQEGEPGHLWLSTAKGLSEFDIGAQEFRNYDVSTFSRSSNIKSRTGEIFFGSTNGVISFFPENIINNEYIPPVVITSIKIFEEEIMIDKPVWEISELELSYTESFFAFEFSALDFSDPSKNQYKYKLEGFNSDWITLTSERRYASYTSIDGGDYTFRVIGSNNDGVWNEEGISINIHVTPPFWSTWWFYLVVSLIVIGIFSVIYQAKVNQFRAEKEAADALRKSEEALKLYSEQLEIKVDERTKELRDTQGELIKKEKLAVLGELAGGVAHELRNPLSVISNSVYYLNSISDDEQKEKKKQYLDMIFTEAKNAAKIISDLLNFARKSSIDPGLTDFSEVLTHALVKEPAARNINMIIDVPDDLAKLYTDPLHTEQILMNILTNSYHSMDSSIRLDSFMVVPDGGDLKISARNYKDRVIIRISDTGCGISKENLDKIFEPLYSTKIRGIGLGLSITKNLIELNGGSISVESELGEGTSLTINFPAFIE